MSSTFGRVSFLAIAVVLLSLAGSCATTDSDGRTVELATRAEEAREDVTELLQADDPVQAIQRISSYRRSGLLQNGEADRFSARATDKLAAQFETALEEQQYATALRVYKSLQTLGKVDAFPAWDLPSLLLRLAEVYRAEENYVAALHSMGRIEDFGTVETETLLEYGEIARQHRNRFVLGKLIEALTEREVEVPQELVEFVETEPVPSQMISGTATIWVDRGIRIEDGVGRPDRGIGSGFFIDKRGYLVTNYHVIESEVDPEYEGYSRLFIRLPESPENRIPARVVGYDRIFDIALLKVEVDPPYVFSFTNVRTLDPGARIFAIGSPGGLENSISSGIISATNRRFLQLGDALQVDVPINPGNSGGPLVNNEGDVIGIVFAGVEQFEGVNFAIPSFWIQHFLPELYDTGEIEHPWMGVAVYERRDGLEVIYVAPGSPAETAGIKAGDLITSIDGWEPKKIGDAQKVLLEREPRGLINVEWQRNGTTMSGFVALGERPFSPVEEALEVEEIDDLFPVLFGMRAREISSMPWQADYVVTKIYPGMTADETGLSEQDPFQLRHFEVLDEQRVAVVRIVVKKRKAGFVESGIQLGSYLEVDNFL
jgi:S1-C subfamily serine protease